MESRTERTEGRSLPQKPAFGAEISSVTAKAPVEGPSTWVYNAQGLWSFSLRAFRGALTHHNGTVGQ